MEYKVLNIWVEGPNDKTFAERIIIPLFEDRYKAIKIIEYAVMSKPDIRQLLRSIKQLKHDYIFLTDINLTPCVTSRKKKIKNKHRDLDENQMIVVIREIESWYLAGLDDKSCNELRVEPFIETDTITKEKFDLLKPKEFVSRIAFMVEILKHFSIDTAKHKNRSFNYFAEKYEL